MKKINVLGLMCCTLFIAGMSLAGNGPVVEAKSFESSETQMTSCEYNIPMSLDKTKNVYNYHVEDTTDKQGNDCMLITKYSYKDNKAKKTWNMACYDEWIHFVKKPENSNRTVVASKAKGKGKIRFAAYNKNGKKKSEIIDTFTKKDGYLYNMAIEDIMVKGNSLYYAYIRDGESAHIRCINIRTGKLTDDILLKVSNGTNVQKLKIYNNRIYVLTEDAVHVYSFAGKKQRSYKLPEGMNHYSTSGNEVFYNNYDDISVSGNYIYFINNNGVYRCSIKNKKGFIKFYDAKDDFNFEQGKVFDICVAGKDKFYVMFVERDNIDLNMPTKLVEYAR